MTIFLGIDDTDSLESRGTGRLARSIALELSKFAPVYGVTRHQLFVHESIPFTSHNSSAVIHIEGSDKETMCSSFELARRLMLADFVEGSDPGLTVARDSDVTPGVIAFGLDAKRSVVTEKRARDLAKSSNILLEGLGGTQGGVIGALAGIGLAATQNDGRFLLKGENRELSGVHEVANILERGVDMVMTLDGHMLTDGLIDIQNSPKPSLICGKAVLFVERANGNFIAQKRD